MSYLENNKLFQSWGFNLMNWRQHHNNFSSILNRSEHHSSECVRCHYCLNEEISFVVGVFVIDLKLELEMIFFENWHFKKSYNWVLDHLKWFYCTIFSYQWTRRIEISSMTWFNGKVYLAIPFDWITTRLVSLWRLNFAIFITTT